MTVAAPAKRKAKARSPKFGAAKGTPGFNYQQPITMEAISTLLDEPRDAVRKVVVKVPQHPDHPGYYPLSVAIAAVKDARKEKIDALYERARKDRAQASKTEAEDAILRRKWAPIEDLLAAHLSLIVAWKSILGRAKKVPARVKRELMAEIQRLPKDWEGKE